MKLLEKLVTMNRLLFRADNDSSSFINIKAGSSEFSLPTIQPEEFPSFENIADSINFSISSEILHTLFIKTKHAISNEETRYYLNGIYLHSAQDDQGIPQLMAVATDGHRLALAKTLLPSNAQDIPGIIIPRKAVNEIVKLLDSYDGEVNIKISSNKIVLQIGDSIITSKLIDGKFPDYTRVIPENNDKSLKCVKKELISAIDLVISVSNDKTKTVRLQISPEGLNIAATSELNGNARGEQDVKIDYTSDETLAIGFNSRYVLEALNSIDSNNIELSFSNNIGATILKDCDNPNFFYILMPMQV